jgi:phosphoserine phosphatase RsbU/P
LIVLSIFIVDDSASDRKIIRNFITKLGFGIPEEFANGESALERLRQIEPSTVRAILLDLQMEGMEGIACCLRIRSMPGYADTPVLVVTASNDEIQMNCAFEAGATDYILKPIQKYNLQVRLRNAIQLDHERAGRRKHEQRLQQDIRIAQEIQDRLLTRRLQMPAFQMELLYRPASNLSGDMVFVCPTGPRRYGAILMDVMGHGVSSAFIAVFMQSAASRLMQQNFSPGDILNSLGRQMWDIASLPRQSVEEENGLLPSFLSAVCFEFDLADQNLRWANAGHLPALLRMSDGTVLKLESNAPPLGLFPSTNLETQTVRLSSAYRLIAFSDGILENHFPSIGTGIEYLTELMSTTNADSPEVFLASLDKSLRPLLPVRDMDDVCVMAIDILSKEL